MADILHAFGVNWKLLAIQIVNFGVLLYLLHRFLYKPLFQVMEERQTKIAKGLADAEEARKEKDGIQSEKKHILADARRAGDDLLRELRVKAEREGTEVLKEAELRAEMILKEGETLGARKKEEIINESKDELAKLAVKAAEQILHARKA